MSNLSLNSISTLGLPKMNEPRRLQEGEEGRGVLVRVLEQPGSIVAVFEWGSVLLPGELAPRLRELIGKRAGVLRLEGYRVKAL